MPTLHWIGKEAVTNHHKDVPYRMLEPDEKLGHGEESGDGNLIVQGDNLHALKALLPKYAGKVKCIYIDPPYNTGNEGWVYNDNVKAPEIKKWLGQVVGKEAEDLSRHDKWLCMMYPRLVLLKQFLAEDGAIFVSIDDNEISRLRLLLDELFASQNLINTVIWEKRYSPQNAVKWLSESHDFIAVYAKNKMRWKPNLLERTAAMNARYRNLDNDSRGVWKPADATAQGGHGTKDQFYTITSPNGKKHNLPSGRCWVYTQGVFEKLVADNRVWFGSTGNNVPAIKRFLSEVKQGTACQTIWKYSEVGHSQEAKKEIKNIFPYSEPFDTPKPTRLIQRILQIATDKDSIILDSFAGSGTTAHAVLKQNAEDGGNRKFILCEMEANIAENITAERVRRVAAGYTNSKDKEVEGLGGSFQYCRLSDEPLFDADGRVRPDVTFDQLAEFVWFHETGKGWHGWETDEPKAAKKPSEFGPIFDTTGQIRSYPRGPLLGIENNHAFILLYNGILKDRSDLGGNVLNQRTLDYLRETVTHTGPMTIFAARCRFATKKLRAMGITYKQLPYRIDK